MHRECTKLVCLQVYLAVCILTSVGFANAQLMPVVVEPNPDKLIQAVLHRVIDGDSVELFVDGAIVRYELAGADAPDLLPENTDESQRETLRGSKEAKAHLQLLLEGESIAVYLDSRKRTDTRGNLRAYIYRMPDGLFVNLEMVRLGFSKHARDPLSFNDASMLWAQDKARDARKGVWSPAPKPVRKPVLKPESKPSARTEVSPKSEEQPSATPTQQGKEATNPEQTNTDTHVYVTQSGSKYHTKDCRHVKNGAVSKALEEVQDSHQPCKVCNPDSSD
ncbi:MAG: thermonuclease family protein [Phycisphaerales bacterium]